LSPGELDGKVMVVTGGSRGIGRAIVLGAIARGARVAYCARKIAPATQDREQDKETALPTDRVLAVRCDVSQESDVEELFDATLNAFGKVDLVVNNAGTNFDDLIISMSPQDWDAVLATNLTGAFLVSRRAVKEFLARGVAGRIVSITSVAQNGANSNAGYAASKGGLAGLTRAIAEEYGHAGIRAHAVVSGFVETELTREVPPGVRQSLVDMSPQRRAAKDSEIASVVLFLASSRSWIANGEAVYVSGGLLDAPPYVTRESAA
jgi:3-oxoacyl-[acyl-carrier protein] reductase